jgi:hypothetical protein
LKPAENADQPLFAQPWPGYWKTRARLAAIIRFKNLIVHRERRAGSLDEACPIEELFPNPPPVGMARTRLIDREIKRAQQEVWWELTFAGIPTVVAQREYDEGEHKGVLTKYDVILDYFRLPLLQDARAFDLVLDTLEQGIGAYERRLKRAKRELYSPVAWVAHLIRLPISVMERAGFAGHEKTQELILSGYARFMRIMMGIIVVLSTLLLGIKVPWREIVSGIIDFMFK